jgi:hypothetical protein
VAPIPSDLTVAELFVAYLRFCEQYYVKNGETTNQVTMIHLALKVAKQLYGHSPCRNFGPLALKACRAEFVRNGLSRHECNRRTFSYGVPDVSRSRRTLGTRR